MRRSSPSAQRGAAALFAAVGLLGMLVASAFSIDLAQIYVAKRDLQNMANLAALDVARVAGGCLAPNANRQVEANQAALATLGRLGGEPSWLQGNAVRLGRAEIVGDGIRQFVATNEDEAGQAYAFELELRRAMPSLILPLPGQQGSAAEMRAHAASMMAPKAHFSLSSFGASIDPTEQSILNNALGSVLGAPLNLTVLSYEGLYSSSVELAEVSEFLPGPPPSNPLDEPISFPGLLTAIADTLFENGDLVAAAAVDSLAAVAPNDTVILSDAIGTPSDVFTGAGNAAINTLDLVQALTYQIGDPIIQLTPGITIGPLADLTGQIVLGSEEPPIAVGPPAQDSSANYLTQAESVQGQVDLLLNIGLPGLLDVDLALELDVAEATAELLEVRCADRGRPDHEVDIGVTNNIARLQVKNDEDTPLVRLGIPLPILGLVEVKICWEAEIELGNNAYTVEPFDGPYPETQVYGSPVGESLALGLGNLLLQGRPEACSLPLGVLDSTVDALLTPILAQLTPAVAVALDDALLDPVLAAVGLSIGGAHLKVEKVDWAPPALIRSN